MELRTIVFLCAPIPDSTRSTRLKRNSGYSVVEKARNIGRSGEAELEAPPPWERTRLEAASPWKGPMLLWSGETSCLAASGTGVGVREASAAAVAKAFCKPSEFHYAVYPLLSPSHIAIYDVNAMWSHSTVFTHSIPMRAYP